MTTLTNPYLYNVTVRQIEFDSETLFEARVKELPDVRDYAASAEEAYDLAIDTIETSAAAFAEGGRLFPPPTTPQDDYSGRVTLRLPKTLHRTLATEAEAEAISLNYLIVSILSCHHGANRAVEAPQAPSWNPMPSQASAKGKVVTLQRVSRSTSPFTSALADEPERRASA